MSYSTLDDLVKLVGERELIQLTDDTGQAVNTDTVDAAITTADNHIDGILRGAGHVLPLDPATVDPLREISRDIALYELYGTRITDTSSAYLRYRNSLAKLSDIGSGKFQLGMVLPAVGPQEPAAAGSGSAAVSALVSGML